MFDLNLAIAEWRRKLAAAGVTSLEVLDELETHLRDHVEEQVRSGADAERALDLAVQNIGTAGALKTEFNKSGRPKGALPRSFWRGFYFLSAVIAILIDLWTLILFELSTAERVAGACAVACFAFYILSLPILPWWRGGVAHARLLAMMKAMGLILALWPLWALLTALQLIHVELAIVPTMAMWSLCAAYGLTGLACGLNEGNGRSGSGGWLAPPYPMPGPIPPRRPCPRDVDIPVPPSTAFTPIAQQALELAREEALRLGHDFIGTEHVLLGVLRMASGTLAQVLHCRQLNGEVVRAEIERLVSPLPAHPTPPALQFTPRARKALQFAGTEAYALKHPSIRPEHVLLGLLDEGGGVAALALKNLGIRIEQMREEVSTAGAQ